MVLLDFFQVSNQQSRILLNFLKKREQLNKEAQRFQSIASFSIVPAPGISSIILSPTTVTSARSLTHTSASISTDSSDSCPPLSLNTPHLLTDEIRTRTSKTIIEWLEKNKKDLSLINIHFQQEVDFQFKLNDSQDGIIVQCKCGTKRAIGQKHGALVVRNLLKMFFPFDISYNTWFFSYQTDIHWK